MSLSSYVLTCRPTKPQKKDLGTAGIARKYATSSVHVVVVVVFSH